jgi:DNA-directed RNA polymerase specialized sigma24 family protein
MTSTVEACRDAYRDLLRAARGCTRSLEEARDLAQDVLVIALARGLDDWPSPARRAWLRGVVRKRAALLVRSQMRRRCREALPDGAGSRAGAWSWQPRFLASLPPSLRVVATFASADLCAGEIRWLLGLSDTALRQRLSALRRAVRAEPEPPTLPAPEPRAGFGGHRAQLLAALRRQPSEAIATHDPDGHPLFLCVRPHKTPALGNIRAKESSNVETQPEN